MKIVKLNTLKSKFIFYFFLNFKMSKQLRSNDEGWYIFYFNSKPNEYGDVYKYKILFQYRQSTDNEMIYNSVKMLNDCETDILYFDDKNCEVSCITSVPTEHTIIGVKGSIDFLNKVIKKLKDNEDNNKIWHFNEKYFDTPFEELYKLTSETKHIQEKYDDIFREKLNLPKQPFLIKKLF